MAGGFSANVFDTGQGQVIKIRNKDVSADEWPEAFLPKSRYVLQPICVYDNFAGFMELALFPKLKMQSVNEAYVAALKYKLGKEGLDFFDDKVENIGLARNVPYVIDSDAIKGSPGLSIEKPGLPPMVVKWPESQWDTFPCKVDGVESHPHSTWIFDEAYGCVNQGNQRMSTYAAL